MITLLCLLLVLAILSLGFNMVVLADFKDRVKKSYRQGQYDIIKNIGEGLNTKVIPVKDEKIKLYDICLLLAVYKHRLNETENKK